MGRVYRAQTKGRVESGVKYVRHNFCPTTRFTDLDDLNVQAIAWAEGIANQRIHGTTGEIPGKELRKEQPALRPLPGADRLQPFLREVRRVQRDAFVQWQRSWYGVSAAYVSRDVEVQPREDTIEIWAGPDRIAVHPKAVRPRQRMTVPGQWTGQPSGDARPLKEPLAAMIPAVEVEQRSLTTYETVMQ